MKLTRLNGDSAWYLELDGTRLLIDPWLEGPAVLAWSPVHRAVLGTPSTPIADAPKADAILLSHPYPDHTHAETLSRLDRTLPVVGSRIVCLVAKLVGGSRPSVPLTVSAPTRVGAIDVHFGRGGWFDPTHNVYLLRGVESGKTLVYTPHGMIPTSGVAERFTAVAGGPVDVLLTSFDLLDLPFWVGGIAKLGLNPALALVDRFQPRFVARTHDGEKPDTGLLSKVQRWEYCRDVSAALGDRPTTYLSPGLGEPVVFA